MKPSRGIRKGTRRNTPSGHGLGREGQAASSQSKSTPSATPSSSLNKQWRQPKSVRQFASQASAVCTLLLNGKLDLETAKAYSAIARTVSQAVTAEVQRSRFLQTVPELAFDQDVFEDGND